MEKDSKIGWDYVDDVSREFSKYEKLAKEALSQKKYGDAATYFEKAYESTKPLEDMGGLMPGARGKANLLEAQGFKYSKKAEKLRKKEERKKSGLLKRLGFILIIFALSLFLLSPNITGGAIYDLSKEASNTIGLSLIVLGAVGLLFIFNKRKI